METSTTLTLIADNPLASAPTSPIPAAPPGPSPASAVAAVPAPALQLHPAHPQPVRAMRLVAEYFEGQIDLKRFRAANPHHTVLWSDPLVLEPERGHYVVLTKFGSVVFWNCPDALVEDINREIEALPEASERSALQDSVTVYVGKPEDKVTFSEIWLRSLQLDHVKIISLALAQSVALEKFETEVTAALRKAEPVITALRQTGAVKLRESEILKTIGLALDVRAAVLANLTLFDKPPETWESEALEHLDSVLYDHFDLEERLSAINQKVDYLSDMNNLLMNLLQTHKSHRLEWIIILLIMYEIVAPLMAGLWKLLLK